MTGSPETCTQYGCCGVSWLRHSEQLATCCSGRATIRNFKTLAWEPNTHSDVVMDGIDEVMEASGR